MDLAWRWRRAGGAEAGGAAHEEHPVHAGHARDVPSERLVEPGGVLPSVRGEVLWETRWDLIAWWVASSKRCRGAAHLEHPVHAGHARDVPKKRLVERSCRLPGEARHGGKWEARLILRGGWRPI